MACQCNLTPALYFADCFLRQEHITTTKKGSITSVQAVYVPADDLTDPSPATTFAHLDATTVLSCSIAELGINPLDSKSRTLDPHIVVREHYKVVTTVQKILQDYKSLQDIIPILGTDKLSEEDKSTVRVSSISGTSIDLKFPAQVECAHKIQRLMLQHNRYQGLQLPLFPCGG